MLAEQTDWIVPLLSAGAGAVLGSLITVLSEWALTSIRESAQKRKDRKIQLRAWWKNLRLAVHRFDLLWTPWAVKDNPNFDEPKPWLAELFEELLQLRSTLGPCEVRSKIDQATRELSSIQQLQMEYMGQAAEAYEHFETRCNVQLKKLKELADTLPDD